MVIHITETGQADAAITVRLMQIHQVIGVVLRVIQINVAVWMLMVIHITETEQADAAITVHLMQILQAIGVVLRAIKINAAVRVMVLHII